MKRKFLTLLIAAAVPALILSGCSGDIQYYKSIYSFGTEASLSLYNNFNTTSKKNKATSFGSEVSSYLTDFEDRLDAAIEAFNGASAGETVTLGEDAFNVLSLALDMYQETDGYYNSGVYPLVDLFGFSARFSTYTYSAEYKEEYDRTYTITAEDGTETTYATATTLPDAEYITAFTELAASFGDIALDSTNHTATKPAKTVTVNGTEYSLKIDLGGIAKGYAADKIGEMMTEAGYEYGYFSFGSSSMYIAKSYTSKDENWTLTVRNPRGYTSDNFVSVKVTDTAVSTSGDYERAYFIGDVRFCHIINPYTGLPVNVEYSDGTYSQEAGIISAAVFGGSAAENDARTTALMAMNLEKAVEYINSDKIMSKNLQIFMVYLTADGEMQIITNVAEGDYTITDTTNFTLASTISSDGKVTYTG